ncbi:replicative DNA helicase [Actinophytocola sp.]|uniref:replicative DNA helicase n=1 Tax=Actinophytocola sp. TaxID=1872138 RepID=UPI002D5C7308|nr:DnaB-like helicase C-terminal domain-containing protein [Actinophytocola sp.]HYQ69084.1 DnaB-like helicase C-terminal domain-containing protein [Actinophytocola sp.]
MTAAVEDVEPVSDVELDAERAVLGAMMTPLYVTSRDGEPEALSSPVIAEVRRTLSAEHFYQPRHQAVMRAICDLADSGRKGIEPVQVAEELRRRGELTRMGSPTYLHDLLAASRQVAATGQASHLAEIVRAGANRRATLVYSQRVAQAAQALPEPERLPEIIAGLHTKFLADVATTSEEEFHSIGNSEDLIQGVLDSWGHPQESAMTTGIRDVDRALNVDLGALVVAAGRPGSGKSVFGAQVAGHYAMERGEPVVFFSAEMTRAELVQRDLARQAGVRLDSASGKTHLIDSEKIKLAKAAQDYKLLGTLLWYDDTPHLSLPYIRARVADVASIAGPPRLIVIDYLQLMQLPKADRKDLALGEVTRQLKIMAQELNCIVLLLCQLNRGPESRPGGLPMLSDLRESGAIEQDADVVMLIHDVAKYTDERPGEIDLILAKQRKGSNPTITLADYRAFAAFRDLSRQSAPSTHGVTNLDDPNAGWWQN